MTTTTTFDIITEATWICRHCGEQKTHRGADAQIQATASGMEHMANNHKATV